MASLGFQFNAYEVDPQQAASQLPVSDSQGWPVIIKSSEPAPCKDPESGMLVFTLEIIDGPCKGASGPYRLNLWNKNPQAAEIAQKQLSALCHVTGVFMVSDSSQLHNIPFRAIVEKQKDSEYTQVKGVLDINGNQPGKAGSAPLAAANGAWGNEPNPHAQAPVPPVNGFGAAPQTPQQPQGQWAAAPVEQPANTAPPAQTWQPGAAAPGTKPPWQK